MPSLSDSMEQGLVLQWLIADGEQVAVGDDLVEIETDKATMTYQAEIAGALQIVAAAGTTVPVGEVIAHLGPSLPVVVQSAADEPAPDVAETAPPSRNGSAVPAGSIATPVARRLAGVHGIALDSLTGSGPRGRITKADVLRAADPPLPGRTPPPPPPPANTDRAVSVHALTRVQQTIARRMAQAKSTIPHFQVQTEVTIDAALALRADLKQAATDAGLAAPSLNDLIVKAAGLALARHPHANGSYVDGRFELHERINIGVAVATRDALVVPTIFDAERKSVGQIAAETRLAAERVRSGQVTPPELSGATFTVSNLGMYGMTAITPVVNPPQAAILGVGAARSTLARDGDRIVDRSLLTLTLSCDHRILYGADAARFLADVRDLLEDPLRLML